jgi:hypothetical protein
MNSKARRLSIPLVVAATLLSGCGEDWSCQTSGKTMYSVSESGELGPADKGCSCEEMRAFELREFGEVDEAALESDFGC